MEGTSKQYIYFQGKVVGYILNNQLYYVHNDHLGRPEVITNNSRTKVWQAKLEPFTRTVTSSSIGDFNVGFPGQYWDEEKGSYYNMFRDYDPETGRYLQSDPIGLAGGMNTYAYVGGNPVNFFDSLGLTAEQVSCMLSAAQKNNPDLDVPDDVAIAYWFGGKDTAVTNPITTGVTLSSYYLQELDASGIKSAYKTIVHESIHRTKGRLDMITRPFEHPDIYKEAVRRADEFFSGGGEGGCSCK